MVWYDSLAPSHKQVHNGVLKKDYWYELIIVQLQRDYIFLNYSTLLLDYSFSVLLRSVQEKRLHWMFVVVLRLSNKRASFSINYDMSRSGQQQAGRKFLAICTAAISYLPSLYNESLLKEVFIYIYTKRFFLEIPGTWMLTSYNIRGAPCIAPLDFLFEGVSGTTFPVNTF